MSAESRIKRIRSKRLKVDPEVAKTKSEELRKKNKNNRRRRGCGCG